MHARSQLVLLLYLVPLLARWRPSIISSGSASRSITLTVDGPHPIDAAAATRQQAASRNCAPGILSFEDTQVLCYTTPSPHRRLAWWLAAGTRESCQDSVTAYMHYKHQRSLLASCWTQTLPLHVRDSIQFGFHCNMLLLPRTKISCKPQLLVKSLPSEGLSCLKSLQQGCRHPSVSSNLSAAHREIHLCALCVHNYTNLLWQKRYRLLNLPNGENLLYHWLEELTRGSLH